MITKITYFVLEVKQLRYLTFDDEILFVHRVYSLLKINYF